MNEKIIKPGVVRRIVDLAESRGHSYEIETVNNILEAFLDVMEQTIEDGNRIVLNGYMTIEPQYRKQRKARNVHANTEMIVPERYRAHIVPGTRLEAAAKRYTERVLNKK